MRVEIVVYRCLIHFRHSKKIKSYKHETCLGYACTYMHVPVCLCARSHRFSTWIALLQQKVIYESEFNKHVRMIYAHTHTHTIIYVCVCVCRCESMWHTMRCRYVCVCVSGIYVCTNIRILLTEFAAAAVAKQNTPQHTTHNRSQHSTTQHNTTQQNKTHSNAIRSVRRLTRLLGMKVDL